MRKLLKYDIRSVFRGWWILSIAVLGIGALGGLCLRTLIMAADSLSELGAFVSLSAMTGVGFSILALALYGVGTLLLVLRRFYCHFFTDEGYLTFTLPVSRRSLLISKTLTALLFQLLAMLVIALSGTLIVSLGVVGTIPEYELWQMANELMNAMRDYRGYVVLYGVELVVELLAQTLFSALFPFLCITIGAIVARQHKVLAAIGIYYGGTMLLSAVGQIGFTFFFTGMIQAGLGQVSSFFAGAAGPALFFLGVILLDLGLAVLCFCLTLRLLNRRLNLS